MNRVGLFGGSFDPPHLAHLIIAEAAREQGALDHVLWIPARRPPHKADRTLAPAEDRLRMTQLAVAGHPAFAVSEVELRREAPSYTVDTIRALQEAHPGTAFTLLVGGDSLDAFGSWYRPEEIIERVPLLVYGRPGSRPVGAVDPRFAGRVRFIEAPLLGLSSTAIRERARAGRSLRYLVPDAVRHYIDEKALYR